MGQILHGCARTTEVVRREIQNSKESVKALSERLGLNYKTVLKWKSRDFVHDMPMGPKNPHSTVLTREAKAERQRIAQEKAEREIAQAASQVIARESYYSKFGQFFKSMWSRFTDSRLGRFLKTIGQTLFSNR